MTVFSGADLAGASSGGGALRRLDPRLTAVIVLDLQERLAAAMPADTLERVVRSARLLAEASRLLGSPCFYTEQYPKGLGVTVGEVLAPLKDAQAKRFEKLCFSACDLPEFKDAVAASGAESAVVIGVESHVCVYQTVRDLVDLGLEVHVPIDGVASRREDHREVGLCLCEQAGAIRTTTESVIFDWLREASGDAFKALSKAIR